MTDYLHVCTSLAMDKSRRELESRLAEEEKIKESKLLRTNLFSKFITLLTPFNNQLLRSRSAIKFTTQASCFNLTLSSPCRSISVRIDIYPENINLRLGNKDEKFDLVDESINNIMMKVAEYLSDYIQVAKSVT